MFDRLRRWLSKPASTASDRCESRHHEGARSWQCVLDAGHEGMHATKGRGRHWWAI